MKHIRAVLSQSGVAIELHESPKHNKPITLALIRPAELETYRAHLAKSNPNYRHATLGQLAIMYANRIAAKGVAVSQSPWTYNASTDEYEAHR